MLKGVCPVQLPPVMTEPLSDLASKDQCNCLEVQKHEEMGWALKKRVERKPLEAPQIAYLLEKYNEGEKSRKKFTGHEVAKAMKRETIDGKKRFLPSEWLKWTTIDSFFSRETQRRRKTQLQHELHAADPHLGRQPDTNRQDENTCPTEQYEQFHNDLEHADDPDQDYLYDDTVPQEDDTIREALHQNLYKVISVDID